MSLPRDSAMSISPDRGQTPYVLLTGSIQMAGHSQSPRGSLAVTSTRPYLMWRPGLVVTRADLTGGTMDPLAVLVTATQSDQACDAHPPLSRRLMMLPLVAIRLGSCRVGFRYSMPPWTNAFSSVA